MLSIFSTCLAWGQRRRRTAVVGAALISALILFFALSYLQARHYSTTQVARFLSDDAQVAAQFTARGLRADETVLTRSGQDVSYITTHVDAWGSTTLKGSVSVMPSSGGAQIIWTLEHDAGWNPLRRWLGASFIASQGAALQARLQAFKQNLNAPPRAAP